MNADLLIVLAAAVVLSFSAKEIESLRDQIRLCEARRKLHTKAARECDGVLVECESNLGKAQTSYDALWQACRK